ncbi:MAG: putative selenium-dependent hydroxylase accessory protein YqeC [Anaerolineaceae bacterium]|nr:putative selenium-dependent hydroxylase accessory protein YqeC [Anaerolineaceae bacterium]
MMQRPEQLVLADIAGILPSHPFISIAGAGGKTTLMFLLAENLPGAMVTTTTTKVGNYQIERVSTRVPLDDFPPEDPGKIIWTSPSLQPQNGKIYGCSLPEFNKLAEQCQSLNLTLIAETDGAARRHIKAPADHEPNIPGVCNVCFYLVGLDVLGKPLNAGNVHRPEILSKLTGAAEEGGPLTVKSIIDLLEHPSGGLKNVPDGALRIACLTHANTADRIAAASVISENLRQYDYIFIH